MNYALKPDLLAEIEIPADGTISRTIHADEAIKVVLFGFSPGQELSEHTASMPVILQFLKGRTRLTMGGDEFEVEAGAWIHMPPHLPHSVHAVTEVVMLLTLLKPRQPAS